MPLVSAKQLVHQAFGRHRAFVREIGVDFFTRRRKSGEVKGEATNQGALVGGCGERKPFGLELAFDQGVDRRACRCNRRIKGPKALIFSALLDPLLEQAAFGLGQCLLVGLGRRHDVVRISARHPMPDFAVLQRTRLDRGDPIVGSGRAVGAVCLVEA